MPTASEPIMDIMPITRRTDAAEVANAAYQQLFALLEQLTPADWLMSTECAGWTVRDMVGHMLGAAQANASIRENLRQQLAGVRHRSRYGGNPLDAVNAAQIENHAALSSDQVVVQLRAIAPKAISGRMRTPAAMRVITVPMSAAGSSASGMPRSVNLGHLADVVYTRDVWMHTIDIGRAVGRPVNLGAEFNRRIVADVVAEWTHRHRQPVNLTLAGPAGGHYQSSSGPDATAIELEAVEFCRILSGREAGEGLLANRVLF